MRIPALLALGAMTALAACEFDREPTGTGSARPVVHAVLNPFTATEFPVLLERTLGGRIAVREGNFDTDDPVVSGGGEPISDARVVISSEDGTDTGVGIEAREMRTDGKGRGVYVFQNVGCGLFSCPSNGILVRRGFSYRLSIETPHGEIITGALTVPMSFPRPDTGLRRTFDATTDTYVFRWPAAESLNRYAVQIQTPFGPFQTFSSVESLAVNGSLRNFQHERFPRVFVPGFRQPLQAFAVDRNYFDYFRSENNGFTGQGLVSSVTGATGVFGAIHPIRQQDMDVVAPFDEATDGRWTLIGDATGFPPRLTTYTDGAFASGRVEDVFDPDQITLRGIIGSRTGTTMRFAVLRTMSLRDTAWTMTAEVRGDTLVTTSSRHGEQRWRRTSAAP
jgi:hypothetical protein